MATNEERIEAAILSLEGDTELIHEFMHSPNPAQINTESGPVPTIPTLVAELRVEVMDVTSAAVQAASSSAASASQAAQGVSQAVTASNASADSAHNAETAATSASTSAGNAATAAGTSSSAAQAAAGSASSSLSNAQAAASSASAAATSAGAAADSAATAASTVTGLAAKTGATKVGATLKNGDASTVQAVISGLGTASAIDTGNVAGKLKPLSVAIATVTGGLDTVDFNAVMDAGAPWGAEAGYGTVLPMLSSDPAMGGMIGVNSAGDFFVRGKLGGTWSPWRKLGEGSGLPVGAIQPWGFARASLPAGWIARDGQILNRADWPDLWALVSANAISDAAWLGAPYTSRGAYSSGNGSTTFRMPDTNGKHPDGNTIAAMFLRGDGKNSAGTPGLHQADQVQAMKHRVAVGATSGAYAYGADTVTTANLSQGASGITGLAQLTGPPVSDGVNGTPRVGSETRPSAETVIWCTVGANKAVNTGSVDVAALATTVSTHSSQLATLDARATALEYGYISPNMSYSVSGLITLNHTLGVKPGRYVVEAEFVAAQDGYAVGDICDVQSVAYISSGAGAYGCTVSATATQIFVKVAVGGLVVVNKTNSQLATLNPPNVVIRVKASKA